VKIIYICHPYSGDPESNREKVAKICMAVARTGLLPLAPQIYLPQFIDEETQRELAMEMCRELLTRCDVLGICGDEITAGMKEEIALAEELGITKGTITLVEGIAGFPSMENAVA